MTERTCLGKIESITLGGGGYDGAMFGVDITLKFDGSLAVGDFKGFWSSYPKGAKYSKEEWEQEHINTYFWLMKLMTDAKVKNFNDLKGKPVEVTVDGNLLKSWRILTEVL